MSLCRDSMEKFRPKVGRKPDHAHRGRDLTGVQAVLALSIATRAYVLETGRIVLRTPDVSTLNLRTLKPFIVWTVTRILYYLMARLIAKACGRVETRLRAHSQWKGL